MAKEANLDACLIRDTITALNNLRKRRGAMELRLGVDCFLP